MASADFTVADVLAWARTKPADEAYRYGSNNNCALCQFLRETERCLNPAAGGEYWRNTADLKWTTYPLPESLIHPLTAGTFGALVTSLEALCPETPVTQSNWSAIDAYLSDVELVQA